MSPRFYAAWAIVVVLALVLPIAIPYAVWRPADTGPGTWDGPVDEVFAKWARRRVDEARFVPTTVTVHKGPVLAEPATCDGPSALHRLPRIYTADVTVRGAYGVPLTTYHVQCDGSQQVSGADRAMVLLSIAALAGGMIAVSTPFAALWLRAMRRDELQPAT